MNLPLEKAERENKSREKEKNDTFHVVFNVIELNQLSCISWRKYNKRKILYVKNNTSIGLIFLLISRKSTK